MITEKDIRDKFDRGIQLRPMDFRSVRTECDGLGRRLDLLVEGRCGEDVYLFDVEIKARSAASLFEIAVSRARELPRYPGRWPMIVLPYLSTDRLEKLEQLGISGIDLCGNGVVIVPGRIVVCRSGLPNCFRESVPTKYAYRGNTSLVPRVFLCRTTFGCLADINNEIQARGGSITLSTISKALKRMEDDVLIARDRTGIRLLQPDGVLEKLASSFQSPKVRREMELRLKMPLPQLLREVALRQRMVLSGGSSALQYAVMGRGDEESILYCERVDEILAAFGDRAEQSARFVNVRLRETTESGVFFDTRTENGLPYASPVQTWLELNSGDKRDREAAEQVRQFILNSLRA